MKRSARVIAVLLAVFAAVAVAAGCGNGEQNDYVDQVNAIQTDIANAATEASSSAPTNPKEAAVVGHKIADAFEQGANDLADVTPPDEVADLHEQLTQELQSVADQINKAADAFESGNAQQAAQAATELQSSVTDAQTKVNSLIDQINSQFGN
jgi:archaellum component FlaC